MKKIVLILGFLFFSMTIADSNIFAQSEKEILSSHHHILVSIQKCRLWLFEKTGGQHKLIREHLAGTVKPSMKKYPLGLGYITKIEFDPWWYPPTLSRAYFARKGIFLPGCVPPGDKLNFMGKFKIHLSHSVPEYGSIYRIHGVRPGDEDCVGKRVSGGCIRMLNEEGIPLAKIVAIGTPVMIVR